MADIPPTDCSFSLLTDSEITRELDEEIRHLLCAAFPDSASTFLHTRAWNGCLARWTVMLTEPAGRIVAHAGVVARQAYLDDESIELGGVQNVAVHPDFQGQSLGLQLMKRVTSELRSLPIDAGLLFCREERKGFYARFGWATLPATVRLNDEAGQSAATPVEDLTMWLKLKRPLPQASQILNINGRDW